VKQIVDKGVLDAIQIMINPLFTFWSGEYAGAKVRDLCAHCKEKGVGVVAMKTMVGGTKKWESNPALFDRLKKYFPNARNVARAIVKDVLSMDGVSAVGVACRDIQQFQDAVSAVGRKLSSTEREGLEVFASAMRSEFCQMCGRCEMSCPQGVPIREMMRAELYLTAYDDPDSARKVYMSVPRWRRPERCDGCSRCESSCPNGVRVGQNLRRLQALVG
jgi:predicted aldo/keto reductase-like oxidoreductase